MSRYFAILCACLLIGLSSYTFHTFSQTKAQAEAALRNMTPEEIEKKLKDLGMTREEASNRAAAFNINLEEYLSKIQPAAGSVQAADSQASASLALSVAAPPAKVGIPVEKKQYSVQGFTGRTLENLQPFGYSIFHYAASTFEPVLNIATPPSYALGPGDEVVVSVWGDTKLFYQLPVNREGSILVPDVGPVPASGMTVQQLREKMLGRMTAVYSSLRNGGHGASSFLDVSLGKLRTIQVFVLGEVQKPGGYSLSSLSTALHALYLSGGPTINGSLRNIQVVRNGKAVSTLDFYEYALRADKSKDVRLQDGDIIFIKPVGTRVGITGWILRPALYELSESENLGELLDYAGGLRFDAYTDRVHIERLVPFDERKNFTNNYLDFDLEFKTIEELTSSKFEMKNGDIVTILQVGKLPTNRVTVRGNVKKPGVFELVPGMRIKDVILAADSLDRNTFSERGTLFRLLTNLRKEVFSFSLKRALQEDPVHNLELKNEDEIMIYKESQFFPEHTVSVGGAVRNPGVYPRYDSMTVSDLVVMAGGLTEEASRVSWELASMDTTKMGSVSKITKFDAPDQYWKNHWGKIGLLEDFDHLMVPTNPKYSRQRVVQVTGYVLYPGSYAIQKENEKLSSIIKRAGGLRPGAYLEGSTVKRTWNDAGLVPVDFEKALDDDESRDNISMLDGDVVTIAFKQEVVLVRGEVFVPSAVVYKKGASLSYYLDQAGGLKDGADDGRIFVTMPNGRRWEEGWFIFPNPDIPGGSVIFVPKEIEKENKTLPIMRDWATIMLSLATMVVAIYQITR
jgi:polysaccharide biosynthesis/export protein